MDEIINIINTRITAALTSISEAKMIGGLAEPVVVRDDADQTWPGIVNSQGECNVNLFDDQYAVGLYHKMTKITYQESTTKGYGDGKSITRVADMSLIAYGDRAATDQYGLAEKIRTAITGTRDPRTNKEICSVSEANFNRVQVFAGEFGGIEFFLQPHVFLFRINYRIQTALPECINTQGQ